MATDVKLGLVVGLGVVLAVAVTYFPKAGPRARSGAVVPSLPVAARGAEGPARLPPAESPATAAARLDPR